jgi:hypothetical protein
MKNTEEGRRIGCTHKSAWEGRIGEERRGCFVGEEGREWEAAGGRVREAAHTCTGCFVDLLLYQRHTCGVRGEDDHDELLLHPTKDGAPVDPAR